MRDDKIPLVNDPMLLNVLQLFKSESGVYLVTIHKRRMVKVQAVGKENLLASPDLSA